MPYDNVYEPLPSLLVLVPLRSHRPLDALYVQPDGHVFVVPVLPFGQQHGLDAVVLFSRQKSTLLHINAIAGAVWGINVARINPTIKFGKQERKKYAEIWDFYK